MKEVVVTGVRQDRGFNSTVTVLPLEYGSVVLHQGSLVHGLHPAAHVLLRVGAEEVRPHPSMLCLRTNHRAPVVNVGAHTCVAGL